MVLLSYCDRALDNEFDANSKVEQGRDQLLGSNHGRPRIWKVYMRKKKKCFFWGGGELVTIAELANLSGRAAVIGERERRVGC